MNMKTISLIEDDVDGATVILEASSEEVLRADARALWTEFDQYPNKNFSGPTSISPSMFGEDGAVACQFNVSYPLSIAGEVIEDWLRENTKGFEKDPAGLTYSYC